VYHLGTLTLDRVILEIVQDDTPDNPRTWENLGTMVCWHRRYTLGDDHHYRNPQAFSHDIYDRNAVILPLYLFDHSGLSISTRSGAFRACDPAGWDWGQVGYIYAMKDTVRQEFGAKHLARRLRNRVEELLRGEVAVYHQYLHGEVYGFTLTDRETGETIDSCWGFYGENPWTNGMAEYFPPAHREKILSYFYQGAA
jgi:hypothetical protein